MIVDCRNEHMRFELATEGPTGSACTRDPKDQPVDRLNIARVVWPVIDMTPAPGVASAG